MVRYFEIFSRITGLTHFIVTNSKQPKLILFFYGYLNKTGSTGWIRRQNKAENVEKTKSQVNLNVFDLS